MEERRSRTDEDEGEDGFEWLPDELLLKIFSPLDRAQIRTQRLVNHRWHVLCQDQRLSHKLVIDVGELPDLAKVPAYLQKAPQHPEVLVISHDKSAKTGVSSMSMGYVKELLMNPLCTVMPNITSITLHGITLHEPVDDLAAAVNLVSLTLQYCIIAYRNTEGRRFNNLRTLRIICRPGEQYLSENLYLLLQSPELTTLELHPGSGGNADVYLRAHEALQELSLTYTHGTLQPSRYNNTLRRLRLTGCRGLQEVFGSRFQVLEYLAFEGAPHIGPRVTRILACMGSSVKHLAFRDCENLTIQDLQGIPERQLLSLAIHNCPKVCSLNTQNLRRLWGMRLTELRLTDFRFLTQKILDEILAATPALRLFSAANNSQLAELHVEHPVISVLHLPGSPNLSRLTLACPKLLELNLNATAVDDNTLATLIEGTPGLWHLCVSNTPAITREAVKGILATAQRLRLLHVQGKQQTEEDKQYFLDLEDEFGVACKDEPMPEC